MNGRHIIRAAVLGALLLIAFSAPEVWANAAAGAHPSPAKDWLERYGVAAALIAAAVALFGHLIAVRRDTIARTNCPKLESAIECQFFRAHGAERPIELRFVITNKGGARSRISQLRFRVRGIEEGSSVSAFENDPLPPKKGKRLAFPEEILKGAFVHPSDGWLFVDSGTTQTFSFPAALPDSISLILVHIKMKVAGVDTYTGERVFQIPSPDGPRSDGYRISP